MYFGFGEPPTNSGGDGMMVRRGNVLTFKANNPDGDDKINRFVESAKTWYIQKLGIYLYCI